MIRPLSLILLCTSALATGVIVATPSLANVFQSAHVRAPRMHGVWHWSISGGTAAPAAPGPGSAAARTPARRHHASRAARRAAPPAASPPPATSQPPATSEPPATEPPAPTGSGPGGDPTPGPALNPPFTLRTVDARCFYAPSGPGAWPFKPTTAVHPIRGSFDE